jgi:hypothetical protein
MNHAHPPAPPHCAPRRARRRGKGTVGGGGVWARGAAIGLTLAIGAPLNTYEVVRGGPWCMVLPVVPPQPTVDEMSPHVRR